jgi:hypothetical protein
MVVEEFYNIVNLACKDQQMLERVVDWIIGKLATMLCLRCSKDVLD